MKIVLVSFLLISTVLIPIYRVVGSCAPAQSAVVAANPVGRWRVRFTLIGSAEKNLVFEARAKGVGFFQLLDTGPDNKPVAGSQAAAWSFTNDNMSISGEVELPIGTCCRETGTLIFKGKFNSDNSLTGKLIFVTNVAEEESPYQFRSTVGTFTAVRLRNQ